MLPIGLFFGLIAIFLSDDIWDIGGYQEGAAFKPNDTSSESNLSHGNESTVNTTLAAETNSSSFLKVIIRVDNTGGGTAQPSDFYVSINSGPFPAYDVNPYSYPGSSEGTISSAIPGTYMIKVNDIINNVPYSLEFSGGCIGKGGLGSAEVVIKPGDKVTCTITATYANF